MAYTSIYNGSQVDKGIGTSYVPTLQNAPTSSTLTYTRSDLPSGSQTVNFEIGQLCRVANVSSPTGYDFYQLQNIVVTNAGEQDETTIASWLKINIVYSVMGASGSNHSSGLVPDTPTTAGTTKFLREDGTWADTPKEVFEGYLNPSDGNFYETKTPVVEDEEVTGYEYSGLITGADKTIYIELETTRLYRYYGIVYGYGEVGRWYSTATPSVSGTGGEAGLMSATDKEKLDSLPAWSQAANKPSYAYEEIGYSVVTAADNSNTAGIITIDGTKPLTVIALTGDVSSLDLASGKAPEAGHSAHVILTAASACTVAIAHDATARVCPDGEDISLSIAAGGYAEVDFLNANNKIFVRSV